jgi:hypothetical protein
MAASLGGTVVVTDVEPPASQMGTRDRVLLSVLGDEDLLVRILSFLPLASDLVRCSVVNKAFRKATSLAEVRVPLLSPRPFAPPLPTLAPKPIAINPRPETPTLANSKAPNVNSAPCTLHPAPCTLHPKP